MHHTSINKLPNNLTIKGNLYLRNAKIKKLPDDLIVNGEIYR